MLPASPSASRFDGCDSEPSHHYAGRWPTSAPCACFTPCILSRPTPMGRRRSTSARWSVPSSSGRSGSRATGRPTPASRGCRPGRLPLCGRGRRLVGHRAWPGHPARALRREPAHLGIDLSGTRIGQRLGVGGSVVLEVTAPRTPCATFARRIDEEHWVEALHRPSGPRCVCPGRGARRDQRRGRSSPWRIRRTR